MSLRGRDWLVVTGLVTALGPVALLGGWKFSEFCCSPTTITATIVVTETAVTPIPATIMASTSGAGERSEGRPGRRTLTVLETPEGAPPAQTPSPSAVTTSSTPSLTPEPTVTSVVVTTTTTVVPTTVEVTDVPAD